uniref:acylphosphatase n=1 Tax=Clastoptera arizonana TaxID=38151 RepID=A0A1B6E4Z9_9HEMI
MQFFLFSKLVFLILISLTETRWMRMPIISFSFEVFGDVTNGKFKEYTKNQAREWDIRGFIKYTDNNTVSGYVEAPQSRIPQIKEWLVNGYVPDCEVDHVVFSEEKVIQEFSYKVFHAV